MRYFGDEHNAGEDLFSIDRLVILGILLYGIYCSYRDFQQRRHNDNIGIIPQVQRDAEEALLQIRQHGQQILINPNIIVRDAMNQIMAPFKFAYRELRNHVVEIKAAFVPLSATNATNIVALITWLHSVYLYVDREMFVREKLMLPKIPKWIILLSGFPIHIVSFPLIKRFSREVTNVVSNEVPNFLRRVKHRGLQPIREQLTLSNVLAGIATIRLICNTDANTAVVTPLFEFSEAPLKSPVIYFASILFTYRWHQQVNEFMSQQIIGKVTGYARLSYQRIWACLGYHRAQPVSRHDFSGMTEEELTCVIARDIPDADNAVIIANDRHRQVYSENLLRGWINQRITPRNFRGQFANPRTQTDYFDESDIIPAPDIVKKQIREAGNNLIQMPQIINK